MVIIQWLSIKRTKTLVRSLQWTKDIELFFIYFKKICNFNLYLINLQIQSKNLQKYKYIKIIVKVYSLIDLKYLSF